MNRIKTAFRARLMVFWTLTIALVVSLGLSTTATAAPEDLSQTGLVAEEQTVYETQKLSRNLIVRNRGNVNMRVCDHWTSSKSTATKCPGKTQVVKPGKKSTFKDADAIQVPKGRKLQVKDSADGGIISDGWRTLGGCSKSTHYRKVQPPIGLPNTSSTVDFRTVKC